MPIDPFNPLILMYNSMYCKAVTQFPHGQKSEPPITSNRRPEPLANIIWERRNKQKLVINNCFWASDGIGYYRSQQQRPIIISRYFSYSLSSQNSAVWLPIFSLAQSRPYIASLLNFLPSGPPPPSRTTCDFIADKKEMAGRKKEKKRKEKEEQRTPPSQD